VLSVAFAFSLLAATAGPATAQKVVNIWHTEPNAKTKAVVDEIIADFEKVNPGIKVVQEAVGWGDLEKKMQAALASGALPEAAHGQTYVARSLSAKGLLRPLNDVIESIGEDDIFEVVRKLDYNTKDKKYYGLAHAVGTDLIIYRKDFLREAGIPDAAPKTWKEWLEQLKKLTIKNRPGQPRRPGILHQRGLLHVGRVERRTAVRRKGTPDLHRSARPRSAGLLEGAQ
jgi:ABC-type glycerol-3-phosphate transport system substrate-binding protein